MYRRLVCVAAVILASITLVAADFDYGQPEELRGLTKFYVDTGTSLNQRNDIVSRIQKALPNLRLVDKPEDAEIVLIFGSHVDRWVSGVTQNGTVQHSGVERSTGLIFRLGENNRLRLLAEDHPDSVFRFERDACSKFAIGFVKLYKRINDLK